MNKRQTSRAAISPAGESGGKSESNGAVSDNVDKIRDLIFGEQMAGYEERFNALESRLVAEVETLRESVESSLAELKDLTEKRSAEVEDLSVSRKKLGDSLQKLANTIRG